MFVVPLWQDRPGHIQPEAQGHQEDSSMGIGELTPIHGMLPNVSCRDPGGVGVVTPESTEQGDGQASPCGLDKVRGRLGERASISGQQDYSATHVLPETSSSDRNNPGKSRSHRLKRWFLSHWVKDPQGFVNNIPSSSYRPEVVGTQAQTSHNRLVKTETYSSGVVNTEAHTSRTRPGAVNTEAHTSRTRPGAVNTEAHTSRTTPGAVNTEAHTFRTTPGAVNTEAHTSRTTPGAVNTEAHTSRTTSDAAKTEATAFCFAGGEMLSQFDATRAILPCDSVSRQSENGVSVSRQSDNGGAVSRQSNNDGSVSRQSDNGGSGSRQNDNGGSVSRQSDNGGSMSRQSDNSGSVNRKSDNVGSVSRQSDNGGFRDTSGGAGDMSSAMLCALLKFLKEPYELRDSMASAITQRRLMSSPSHYSTTNSSSALILPSPRRLETVALNPTPTENLDSTDSIPTITPTSPENLDSTDSIPTIIPTSPENIDTCITDSKSNPTIIPTSPENLDITDSKSNATITPTSPENLDITDSNPTITPTSPENLDSTDCKSNPTITPTSSQKRCTTGSDSTVKIRVISSPTTTTISLGSPDLAACACSPASLSDPARPDSASGPSSVSGNTVSGFTVPTRPGLSISATAHGLRSNSIDSKISDSLHSPLAISGFSDRVSTEEKQKATHDKDPNSCPFSGSSDAPYVNIDKTSSANFDSGQLIHDFCTEYCNNDFKETRSYRPIQTPLGETASATCHCSVHLGLVPQNFPTHKHSPSLVPALRGEFALASTCPAGGPGVAPGLDGGDICSCPSKYNESHAMRSTFDLTLRPALSQSSCPDNGHMCSSQDPYLDVSNTASHASSTLAYVLITCDLSYTSPGHTSSTSACCPITRDLSCTSHPPSYTSSTAACGPITRDLSYTSSSFVSGQTSIHALSHASIHAISLTNIHAADFAPNHASNHAPNPAPRRAPNPAPRHVPNPAPRRAPNPAPRHVPNPAPRRAPNPAPRHVPNPAPRRAPNPAPRHAPNPAHGHSPSHSGVGQDIPSRLRVARLLATVCGIFLLCWTPLMLSVLAFYTMGGTFEAISACTTLAVINSAVNFFVYAAANKDFRYAFRRLLCRR